MSQLEKKIPPLLVLIIIGAVMVLLSPYLPSFAFDQTLSIVLGALIIALGLGFVVMGAVEFLKYKTTFDPLHPEKASKLVDSGIFRLSRNPMYVGFAFFLFAISIFLQSPLLVSAVVLFVVYMNRFQITPEERAMINSFGEQYLQYMSRVRRWL